MFDDAHVIRRQRKTPGRRHPPPGWRQDKLAAELTPDLRDGKLLELIYQWRRQGIAFGGILFAPQGTPIGRLVDDVELCLAGMTANEFANRLVHLPLR